MPLLQRYLSSALLTIGLVIGTAPATHAEMDEHLEANGWKEMTFDGKAKNRFNLSEDQVLTVTSDDSVSVLRKPMTIDMASTPILTWRWCVTLVEREAGADAPGRVLMYVWGGQGERGDVQKSPFLGEGGRMIILRPAKTEAGQWFKERIDIAEDYRRIFGNEAPPAMSIAVSSDTDDTESQVRGLIANLDFVTRPATF